MSELYKNLPDIYQGLCRLLVENNLLSADAVPVVCQLAAADRRLRRVRYYQGELENVLPDGTPGELSAAKFGPLRTRWRRAARDGLLLWLEHALKTKLDEDTWTEELDTAAAARLGAACDWIERALTTTVSEEEMFRLWANLSDITRTARVDVVTVLAEEIPSAAPELVAEFRLRLIDLMLPDE